MFYKVIEEYSDIITRVSVSDFRRYGSAVSLVAMVEFVNGSTLHIKDYLFLDGKRKYSYHWQDADSNLVSRWDNSPHHKNISEFLYLLQCLIFIGSNLSYFIEFYKGGYKRCMQSNLEQGSKME